MKTTTGVTGFLFLVIAAFCGSIFAGEVGGGSPENGMEDAVGNVENMGVPVAPLAFEGGFNTLYGAGAGSNLGDDDDYATFIGAGAGQNTIEGTGIQGKGNTFVGFASGYLNTTGYNNAFLGFAAGRENNKGYENTFVGSEAGTYNTGDGAVRNTFVGFKAGNSNSSGHENTFVGNVAGYSNSSGNQNTFLGYGAGYSNTTGYNNIFVGYYAGQMSSGGYGNTSLGDYAGRSNSGIFNTFLGSGAGYSNSTGNYNTFLGRDAGFSNSTGTGNVFVGHWAGRNETGSNKLYIDNSNTSTPLIYGEFDNDIVQINGRLGVLRSPGASYQLDVNGAVNATSFTGDGSGLTNLNEIDPKVGTLTSDRWCTSDGTHVNCSQTAPVTTEVDPKVGTLTANRWCTSNGSAVSCTQTAPVTAEIDPKIGTLTTDRWCTSNGTTVSCTQTAPVTAESDPKVGSNTLNYVPKWTGSALVSGSIYDDGTDVTVFGNLNVVAQDNGLIYLTDTTADNTIKRARFVLSHYSNTQLPVYLFGSASTATSNFVALGGGAAIGSAATQIDLFTAPNNTTPIGTPRLTIVGNGNVGIGTQTPAYPLHMASGARVTTGGVWTDASSREYKEDIVTLTQEEALDTLQGLNPVKFAYKAERTEKHVGFVAEEVPELVATKDRKGLSPMDIVAVLTKVVQEKSQLVERQQNTIEKLERALEAMEKRLSSLEKQ